MIWKTVIFLGFALCVFGDGHHATSEQYIKINHKDHHGHHGELSHIGSKKPEHHEEYAWSYPSYEFSYSVDDPHTHDKKGQKESREGDAVKGEYWLIQPDGRKRTVTYHADKHSGFQADVHYSDHHHDVYEHHGYGKDEHKDEDEDDKGYSKEKVEEKEEKKKESSEESNEESSEESSEEEEGRGAEESRGRQGGAIRWGYGPKWDHEIPKVHKEYRVRESHKDDHDDKHANFGGIHIIRNVGTYGHRDSKKHGRDEGHEESLLWEERRKFDERRGYPSHSTPYYGHASRINPRFQPQIQRHQRRIPSRT